MPTQKELNAIFGLYFPHNALSEYFSPIGLLLTYYGLCFFFPYWISLVSCAFPLTPFFFSSVDLLCLIRLVFILLYFIASILLLLLLYFFSFLMR